MCKYATENEFMHQGRKREEEEREIEKHGRDEDALKMNHLQETI